MDSIIRYWSDGFRQLFGGEWPRSYVTFDCETTGLDNNRDVVVEIGHCLVEDCKVKNQLSLILNWTDHSKLSDSWLRERLLKTKNSMASVGKQYQFTYEKLTTGIEPEKALSFYHTLFSTLIDDKFFFAAHGGFFDEAMLVSNFKRFIPDVLPGKGLLSINRFPDNLYIDTMSIERGNQCMPDAKARPFAGETMRAYFKRLKYLGGFRKGISFSLDGHCIPKYGLVSKYGIDTSKAHSAAFDAYVVHLLMEEFRHITPNKPEPVLSTSKPQLMLSTRVRGQRNR
jgi:DNA polymerase III epsilon subunit-like protein